MVEVAYEEIYYPQVWVRPKKKRTPQHDVTSLLQLMQLGRLTRRQAMERMVFDD
jgi:hypothetical protein